MKRISVSKHQTIQAVYSRPMQILANHTFITLLAPTIEKPVCASRLQVSSRAGAQVQHGDLCPELFRPMRLGDIKMSARNLREQSHDPKNNLCQKPVGIIENYGEPRQ